MKSLSGADSPGQFSDTPDDLSDLGSQIDIYPDLPKGSHPEVFLTSWFVFNTLFVINF